MKTRLEVPRSRLICFGSARALTNAYEFLPNDEGRPDYGYGD